MATAVCFHILWYIRPEDGCFLQPKHVAVIGFAVIKFVWWRSASLWLRVISNRCCSWLVTCMTIDRQTDVAKITGDASWTSKAHCTRSLRQRNSWDAHNTFIDWIWYRRNAIYSCRLNHEVWLLGLTSCGVVGGYPTFRGNRVASIVRVAGIGSKLIRWFYVMLTVHPCIIL